MRALGATLNRKSVARTARRGPRVARQPVVAGTTPRSSQASRASTLRILLLNERCHRNPRAGGAEVHLFEIFSRLAEQGVCIELLCSGFDGAPSRDSHRGVAITRVGSRLSFYTRVSREVRRRVAAGQIDLVVEAHNKVPFLTPLYARVAVLVIHHHLHGWTAFRQVAAPIAALSVLLETLIPFVYRRVPMLTISASSKSDLVRRGLPEEHIDVVPCGIDHVQHRPGPAGPCDPLVVALGRLEPYKRLDLLLRSWPAVRAAVPGAQLAIVGHGQQAGALKDLCRRLGLSDAVTFTGFVPQAEKVSLLQRAALMVQCSRKEGWGLTVTEAYACGTPVVASDVPGLSDSVQDGVTGLLVRAARPAPLAAAITRLLLDEEERARLGARARLWAAGFRWEESAAAVLRAACAAVASPVHPAESPEPAVSSPRVVARLGADAGVLS